MPATVTVTGSTGPGIALAAVVYRDVLFFDVDTTLNVLTLTFTQQQQTSISIAAAATVTATKSGNTWTLVIS